MAHIELQVTAGRGAVQVIYTTLPIVLMKAEFFKRVGGVLLVYGNISGWRHLNTASDYSSDEVEGKLPEA